MSTDTGDIAFEEALLERLREDNRSSILELYTEINKQIELARQLILLAERLNKKKMNAERRETVAITRQLIENNERLNEIANDLDDIMRELV